MRNGRRDGWTVGVVSALALACFTGAAAGQTRIGGAPAAAVQFGQSVAVDGDRVLFGRSVEGAGPQFASGPSAIHAFARDPSGQWKDAGLLLASDTKVGDEFGTTMVIDGDWLAVAAPGSGRGAVYLFQRRGTTWSEVSKVESPDGTPTDEFGRGLALRNGTLIIGAPGRDSVRGAAYVSRRDSKGAWSAPVQLVAGSDPFERLGRTVALDGNRAYIAAPGPIQLGGGGGPNTKRGTVRVYKSSGSAWIAEGQLQPADSVLAFGASVLPGGNEVMVGAPMTNGSNGWIGTFTRNASGDWTQTAALRPPGDSARRSFGFIMAKAGSDLVVSEPGARGFAGGLEVYHREGSSWKHAQSLPGLDSGTVGFSGIAMDAHGGIAAAGAPYALFNEGEGFIWVRDGSGRWNKAAVVANEEKGMTAVRGGEVKCEAQKAGQFGCTQVDLEAFVPRGELGAGRGIGLNDVWGWTDPASKREFALVGRMDGTTFVEVTNPSNPVVLGNLPMHQGANANVWRDIKVYKDHAFIVADGSGPHGMQVFDLRQLLAVTGAPVTFTETAHYDRIASAHNIAINETTGFAFTIGNSAGGETCGGALHMIDIREPATPTFAGCFADPSTGIKKTGYTHDTQCVTYAGPDSRFTGREICFNSSETAVGIADVTDKKNPKALAVASYPNTAYTHQGWLDETQSYFFVDDEGDEVSGLVPKTRTLVWDVKNLEEPVLVREFLGTTGASDHNLYVRGKYMFQSNYAAGLRVIDISDPANPREVGYFDTLPFGEDVAGFEGTWSNYPYFPSGTIVVTSIGEGLYVLKHRPQEPATP